MVANVIQMDPSRRKNPLQRQARRAHQKKKRAAEERRLKNEQLVKQLSLRKTKGPT